MDRRPRRHHRQRHPPRHPRQLPRGIRARPRSLLRCYPPEERAVPIELPAGVVVFFCCGTAHCTRANTTDRDRAGVAFHFLRADYAQENLIAPDRDYRPYLTGPESTGGLREYGVRVAGTWDEAVERVLTNAPW